MNSTPNTDTMASWDAIAESFDRTRRTPWPIVLDFLQQLPPPGITLDLGCGNGRHTLPAAQHSTNVIGIDFSRRLLAIAKTKSSTAPHENIAFIQANLTHLPLCDKTADAILFIAALHNIKTRQNRITALQEASRVLKPTGTALISVWSRWQQAYRSHFLKEFFTHHGEFGDITLNWTQHHLDVPRFYHLYSRTEFISDLTTAGLAIRSLQKIRLGHRTSPDNYFAVVTHQ